MCPGVIYVHVYIADVMVIKMGQSWRCRLLGDLVFVEFIRE